MKAALLPLILLFAIHSLVAQPAARKKLSQFTGDLNGDGRTDLVIADRTNYRDSYGSVKVFYGNSSGIDTIPGWSYECDTDNFLESPFFVAIVRDVNGDQSDELCMLLTHLAHKTSGRSHQDLFLFYGSKAGVSHTAVILKTETDDRDKSSLRDYFSFDYDGDGFADLLAVSSQRNYQALESGWTDVDRKLLLFKGSDSGILHTAKVIRDVNEIIFKDAGDLNGDGISDMLLGEVVKKEMVWTQYFGSKTGQTVPAPFLSYPLLRAITSDRKYNNIAWDFNGDKYDDDYTVFENASPLFKKADSTVYSFEFYPGSPAGLKDSVVSTWSIKTPPGTKMNIIACGDLDGDGFGDFILKLVAQKIQQLPDVTAFLVRGRRNGLSFDSSDHFNLLFHSAFLVNAGYTLIEPLGDINNDGYTDLLVGAETVFYGRAGGDFKVSRLHFLD